MKLFSGPSGLRPGVPPPSLCSWRLTSSTAEAISYTNVVRRLSLPQNPISVLEYLNIKFNPTTDEVAAAFINALDNNRGLTQLDLTLIVMIFMVLPQDGLLPQMFCVLCTLATNDRLKELNLDHVKINIITFVGYAAFTCILCSNSSILTMYHSNHSLEKLCFKLHTVYTFLPEELRFLLRIKRENSISQAASIEIIRIQYSGSVIKTQIFTNLEVTVLPSAISWMGRDGGSNGIGDLVFAFICSMPVLCYTRNGWLNFVE